MAKEKKLWFKSKRYGWGWYPATWEGWIVLLVYLIVVFVAAAFVEHHHKANFVPIYVGFILFITLILLYICWKTGEKPRWRWGG